MSSFASGPSFEPVPTAPPRPTTPPVRLGFVVVLGLLLLAAALVYGVPYFAFRAGYAYEAGRSKAAVETLDKLDSAGVIDRASSLFRSAATAVAPAVVNVQCFKDVSNVHRGMPLPAGAPAHGSFPSSFGSGVIIDKAQGYVVTNGHVVDGADEIQVRVGQGREYSARLVGADAKTDLAVLQLNAPLETQAEWADVEKLDIGDWVLAIGSPFRLERSVTVGIVSAIGRRNLRIFGEPGDYEDFIQTDAAINPGNSGGPLVDLRGRVVGINTAIFSPTTGPETEGQGGNVGIGFAISANLARHVADQIIRSGRVVRGYIGVSLNEMTPTLARRLALSEPRGAIVLDVVPDSPAARAGLQKDDVIVELEGQPVRDVAELRNRTAAIPVGHTARVGYLRDGQRKDESVTIEAMPLLRTLGLEIRTEPAAPGSDRPSFIVERVDLASMAAAAGFRPGQRLLSIGNRVLRSRDEIEIIAGRFKLSEGIVFQVQEPDGQIGTLTLGGRRMRR
jgi:serine protease Do